MRKTIYIILSSLFLFFQIGCSLQPLQVVMVDGTVPENYSGSPQEASNIAYSKGILNRSWSHTGQIIDNTKQVSRYRVKYHSSFEKNCLAVVAGTLGTSKTYPVVLDTGASAEIFINDVHIQENNLEFYPFRNNNGCTMDWGLCDLGRLCIGGMSLVSWPCYYQRRHAEIRLFGLPVFKDKAIIVGLPLLKRFKYIEFDNIGREVTFSLDKPFEPYDSNLWMHYSFVIEGDVKGNTSLMVQIPIAGEETNLQLDTGNGGGIVISTKLWGRICERIKDIELIDGEDLYPYMGSFYCRWGIIPVLKIGDRIVKNVKLSVFPDDSPVMENCQGLLGMQSFRDTVMVLDFENNLMWVKNLDNNQLNPLGI